MSYNVSAMKTLVSIMCNALSPRRYRPLKKKSGFIAFLLLNLEGGLHESEPAATFTECNLK